MTLSHSERKEVLALIAANLTAAFLEANDIDELITLELSTAAQLLGLSVTHAARVLTVQEIGPRTRRVTLKVYKAYLAKTEIKPKGKTTEPHSPAKAHAA
jgi:hypothetical protein